MGALEGNRHNVKSTAAERRDCIGDGKVCYEKCSRPTSNVLVSQVYDPWAPRVKGDMLLSVLIVAQIEIVLKQSTQASSRWDWSTFMCNYYSNHTIYHGAVNPRRHITDGDSLQYSSYHRCVYVPTCCLLGCFAHHYNSAPETSTQELCCKPVQEAYPPPAIASTHVPPKARTHRLGFPQDPAASLLLALVCGFWRPSLLRFTV